MATITTRVEDLASMCKWLDNQKEERCIDLLYHLSEVFDVRRFVQIKTSRYCSQNCPFRMADQADDRRVRDQLKVLTGLKLPGFNWKANNMRMEFDIFWQTLKFVLEGMEIPRDKWYLYILQQLGREGME